MPRSLRTQSGREGTKSLRRREAERTEHDTRRRVGAERSLRRPETIQRRRLLSLLDAAAQQPLTVLSAPAGYGKTVLVGDWVTRAGAWAAVGLTSLTDDGEELLDFWAATLRTLHAVGVDTSGLTVGPSPEDVGAATVQEIGQRIARHGRPVVWVIDCDEFALGEVAARGLHGLLTASSGALRLVLLTRSDPPIPLHRYRLAGELTEVRAADLAFTVSEVAAVMQRAGVELRPPEVAELHARTSGWPAGLKFAAMWLAGRRDTAQAIRDFRGDTANVGAYLMSEVLAKQSAEVQQFLLRTCVAETLYPGLVGALTGRHCDGRVLEFLARGNTFVVPVRDGHGAYRYQPLFREFLRSELAYRSPELVLQLHRSAAGWLAANGRHRVALRHAVAAHAWDDAGRCLLEGPGVAAVLMGPDRVSLSALVAAVPPDAPGSAPALTRAAVALSRVDAEASLAELAAARRWLEVEVAPSRVAESAIVTLSAVATSLGTDLDCAVEAAMAAESAVLTAAAAGPAPDPTTVAILAAAKGRVLFERGDFAPASEAFATAAASATTAGCDGDAVELRGMAALAEVASGNLRRAHELAAWVAPEAAGVAGTPTVAATSKAGALAMAWLRIEEDDVAAATAVFDEVPRLPTAYESRILFTVHALVRARLLRAQGRTDLAVASVQAARRGGATATAPPGWLGHALVTAEAEYLRDSGRVDEAALLLAGLEGCEHSWCELAVRAATQPLDGADHGCGANDGSDWDATTSTVRMEVAHRLVRAEELLRAGDREAAERSVDAALGRAVPENLRLPFLEGPALVRRLLEDTGRMSRLRQQGRTGPGRSGDVALTAREQEVLAHLAELLTTEEIAQAMFVSVNTVRTHVRSVLRKLDVTRRNEAVRRAWEHDLLPGRPSGGPPPAAAAGRSTRVPARHDPMPSRRPWDAGDVDVRRSS